MAIWTITRTRCNENRSGPLTVPLPAFNTSAGCVRADLSPGARPQARQVKALDRVVGDADARTAAEDRDLDELARTRHRQAAKADGFQQLEDRGVGANPQSQREHRGKREARTEAQKTGSVAKVVPHQLEKLAHDLALLHLDAAVVQGYCSPGL